MKLVKNKELQLATYNQKSHSKIHISSTITELSNMNSLTSTSLKVLNGKIPILSGVQHEVHIYSTSQMSKLSLTLCTFSITGSVASLFLTHI